MSYSGEKLLFAYNGRRNASFGIRAKNAPCLSLPTEGFYLFYALLKAASQQSPCICSPCCAMDYAELLLLSHFTHSGDGKLMLRQIEPLPLNQQALEQRCQCSCSLLAIVNRCLEEDTVAFKASIQSIVDSLEVSI